MIDFINQQATQTRRSFQPLLNSLDRWVGPYVESGILLALSAGPDSCALLESVARWPGRKHGKILVASIDHNCRKESLEESRYIIGRAKCLGFSGLIRPIFLPSHQNEDNLRKIRYKLLTEICRENNLKSLCTAHHANDDAENVVMSLVGTGGGNLGASMGYVNYLEDLALLRPFLDMQKCELLTCLTLSGSATYARDSLDSQGVGARAFARKNILTKWSKNIPDLSKKLSLHGKRLCNLKYSYDQLAKHHISWGVNCVSFNLNTQTNNSGFVFWGLKKAMKKLSPNSDLRNLAGLAEKICSKLAGLDQHPKWFKVSDLNAVSYQIPGAKVLVKKDLIIVEKIDRSSTVN